MTTGEDARSRNFILYGTEKTEAPAVPLRAGRLGADLAGGNLRTITYDGVEVLRGVSFLIRDRDWGTYDPTIEGLTIDQQANGFVVSYRAVCAAPDGTSLAIAATISGDQGRLTFEAEALSGTGFETNRCGFCILHPIVGLAGSPVTIEHVDGRIDKTELPDLIEPWQPFKDIRAIAHTVLPDVTAECRMEGDTFEMEDQRNWSDASYKTYVRPLALPWPYRIPPGEAVKQRIVLTIDDRRPSTSDASQRGGTEPIRLSRGEKHGPMPGIGLVVTPEEARATLDARWRIADLGVQELLFHFDPLAGHDAAALQDFAAIAHGHRGTCTLEIAVPCQRPPVVELNEIAAMLREAKFRPNALVVSPSVDRKSTPPGSAWPECPPLEEVYAAARAAFPDTSLGGGMLSYFTELNRKRVPPGNLDFITHCTNPIVHAADDLSVMQTLEALPFITRSVRAIYGDKPYRIGPSTIPMRQNPYGSRTMDNRDGSRIAMANSDPRHGALFAAAFALGYAASVLPAGLERLTLSALTGPFGLIAGQGEPVAEGAARPLFHVVCALAKLAGAEWQECLSSDPTEVIAIAARHGSGENIVLLANLTPRAREIDLSAFAAETSSLTVYDHRLAERAAPEINADGNLVLSAFSVAATHWGG
jgi:D-apionolactonase